jgi:hypothetical protein
MEKVESNKTKEQKIVVSCCGKCSCETSHTVLQSVDTSGREDIGPHDWFSWEDSFQIIQCEGCKKISFRRIHTNSEDIHQVGTDDWEPDIHENLYPRRIAGRKRIKDDHFLPLEVRQIYEETAEALENGQRVLTGVGLRAIIETVCKDKSAAGNNLAKKIDDLQAKQMLTSDEAQILHKLRVFGNEAAHEVKPHNEEQLTLAMDVVEHLLQGAYIYPIKVKNKF